MKNKSNNSIFYMTIVIIIVFLAVASGKIGGNKEKTTEDSTTEISTTEAATTEREIKNTEEDTSQNATTEEKVTESNTTEEITSEATEENVSDDRPLVFKSKSKLNDHYEKHSREMGFASAKDYEAAAKEVVLNKNSLHKLEEEDGDDVYYLEATNEFVIVSPEGYIRTYFNPSDGINYYNRQ